MWNCGKMHAVNWKSFKKLNGYVVSSTCTSKTVMHILSLHQKREQPCILPIAGKRWRVEGQIQGYDRLAGKLQCSTS